MDLEAPIIGIVGCGLVGQKRASSLSPGSIGIVCDIDRSKAERLAVRLGGCSFTDSLSDVWNEDSIEVVIIATINSELASVSTQAVKSGKHVLVEKPGAISSSQLTNVAMEAQQRGRLVRVGYNHRYHPAVIKAYQIVRAGALGELMFVRGRYGQGGRIGYEREWRANPKLSGGGELIDQGVHLIDLAAMFLGEFNCVESQLATYFWDMPVEDNAFLNLKSTDGRTAWLHVSSTEWKNLFSFEIFGRNGKLHIEGLGGSYGTERLYHYQRPKSMGPPETLIYEYPGPDESWKLEMAEFLDDVRLNRTPVPGLQEAGKVMEIVERCYARARAHSQWLNATTAVRGE